MDIEINRDDLTKTQCESLRDIVKGLNFIALNAERDGMQSIARLIRAVIVDIMTWAEHMHMYNEEHGEKNVFGNYMIDASMITAFEFLAKFAALDDQHIKEEILNTIAEISEAEQENRVVN